MRWWQNLPLLRLSPTLGFLLLLLITIQLFSLWFYEDTTKLYDYVGLSAEGLFRGFVWTFVSYALFHHPEHLSHLVFNALMLVYYGGRITHIFGSGVMVRICGVGVIAGAVMYLLFAAMTDSDLFLIGFSGANFALLAAHLHFSGDARFFGVKGGVLLKGMVVLTILCCLTSLSLEASAGSDLAQLVNYQWGDFFFGVSHACHLGGLLAGWFLSWKMIRILPNIKKE